MSNPGHEPAPAPRPDPEMVRELAALLQLLRDNRKAAAGQGEREHGEARAAGPSELEQS